MADTTWYDPDQPLRDGRLVEVDGRWAISDDPDTPADGRVVLGGDGRLAVEPVVGGGLPLKLRFDAPSVIVDTEEEM